MSPPSRTRRAADDGVTLLEILIAMSIMGVAVVAIMAGLGTGIRTSAQHRAQATAGTLLASAAEAVKGFDFDDTCPATYAVTASDVTLPVGWPITTIAITGVRYWDGSAFTGTCTAGHKLQEVTIVVTSPPDIVVSEQVAVVKRDAG